MEESEGGGGKGKQELESWVMVIIVIWQLFAVLIYSCLILVLIKYKFCSYLYLEERNVCVSLSLCVCVCVCVCARGWPQRPPLFNKSIVCVSPDWEHIGPGSGPAGAGVRGLGQTGGPVLRGSLLWSFLFSPQKSRLLRGPRGAAGSPLRSVPPRDDPALPLSGGNLSPLLTDPLPSPQGCNAHTHTQASHQTATQGDEIHVRTQNSHTQPLFSLYQTAKYTHTHSHPFARPVPY